MTNPLNTNYAISWSNSHFTITWSSTFSPVSFYSLGYSFLPYTGNTNYFYFGTSNNYTLLDWRHETSLGASSRTNLQTLIAALVNISPITSSTLDDSSVNWINHSDNTKTFSMSLGGQTTGTKCTLATTNTAACQLNLPSTTDTLVGRATTDTFTNKTLTSPSINSVSVTGNVLQGPFTSGSVTIYFRNNNGIITVRVPGTVGNSSSATQLTAGTGLPVGYRPVIGLYFPAMIQTAAGSYTNGTVTINTSGIIVFWNVGITGFAASGTVGWLDQTFSFPTF
jgi:hypothetical protein